MLGNQGDARWQSPSELPQWATFPIAPMPSMRWRSCTRAAFGPNRSESCIPGGEPQVEVPALPPGDRAGEGAGVGSVAGGAIGGLLGVALATSIIPGVGPVIAGGMLVAAVEAALAGATGAASSTPCRDDDPGRRSSASPRGVSVRSHPGNRSSRGAYDEALAILKRAEEWRERPHAHPGDAPCLPR